MSDVILRAKSVWKSYSMDAVEVKVLRGASLDARKGEFLVVMGASGSGKSTLLHILGAVDAPDRGAIEFAGRSVFDMGAEQRQTFRNREIGFVFQFYHLFPELNVLENVLMPQLVRNSLVGWWSVRRKARREAGEMLERVGLTERARHRPSELSGGERQRVAIARALINRPSLLLADEPTGNLDQVIGTGILDLLAELNRSGQTIVMATHDAKVASRAHRCIRLSEGVIRSAERELGEKWPAEPKKREVAR